LLSEIDEAGDKSRRMQKFLDTFEPEIRVIKKTDVPGSRVGRKLVDFGFWAAIMRRLSLLEEDESLEIIWPDSAFNHGTAAAYLEAKN
jgi:hypothetical protein